MALVFRVSVINFTFEIYIALMLMTPFIFNGVCIHGHTLDLIITRQSDQIVRSTPRVDCYFSDHAPVLCHLHSIKPSFSTRTLSYRKIKLVNVDSLNDDLANSGLCKNPPDDLEELLLSYNKTLIAVLDKHAPVKTRTIVMRPQVPWYTDEIRQAKRERRKAERRWRLSKLDSDLAVFKVKRNAVNNLMNKARQAFYTKLIEDNSCNQRKLFRVSKRLFNQSQLPPNRNAPTLQTTLESILCQRLIQSRDKSMLILQIYLPPHPPLLMTLLGPLHRYLHSRSCLPTVLSRLSITQH